MSKKRKDIDQSLLNSEVDGLIDGFLSDQTASRTDKTPRVVAVPLDQILPNRFHARQLLPHDLKQRFFLGEIDCFQAAAEYFEIASENRLLQKELGYLRVLGQSILKHGQINPATGTWKRNSQDQDYFLLETGVRRFWSLALAYVDGKLEDVPMFRVAELEENHVIRPALENFHRQALTPVEISLTIAGLILEHENIFPHQAIDGEMDYFRKALSIRKIPRETINLLKDKLGVTPEEINRYLSFLELPDEILYDTILYRMPETMLSDILILPKKQQENVFLSKIKDLEMQLQAEQKKNGAEIQADEISETPVYREVLVNHIQDWFELAAQENLDGDFMEMAEGLSKRIKDRSELDLLARWMVNLSRDIRVVLTKRR